MRSVLIVPRGGEVEAFRRGWQVSVFAGITTFAVGLSVHRHASETHVQVYLGPVMVVVERYRFGVGA